MVKISHVSLIVNDLQEALDWYVDTLGWVKRDDQPFPEGIEGRWVTIAPPDQSEIEVVLEEPHWGNYTQEEAYTAGRRAMVGKLPGFVIATDDVRRDAATFKAKGVTILSDVAEMPWGVSLVIADLYGHAHNYLQPAAN